MKATQGLVDFEKCDVILYYKMAKEITMDDHYGDFNPFFFSQIHNQSTQSIPLSTICLHLNMRIFANNKTWRTFQIKRYAFHLTKPFCRWKGSISNFKCSEEREIDGERKKHEKKKRV